MNDIMIEQLKHFSGTIIWVAPFFNRSGYGGLARSTVSALHRCGIPVRIISVGGSEPGIDDVDMDLIKSLHETPVVPPITLIISHVPSKHWLQLKFPEPTIKIISTTYDGCDYDNLPPAEWMAVYDQMDQIWLQSFKEKEVYLSTGIPQEKVHIIHYPEAWKSNPILPPITRDNNKNKPFRFLSIAMFLPRRRWDTLIKGYLEEFKHEANVELYLKVSYPPWHPVPGKPKKDLYDMIDGLRLETGSDIPIIIDDNLGTRRGILDLIDSCNAYVSTDTVSTGPVTEARIRHRLVVVPSELKMMAKEYYVGIDSDPEYKTRLTPEMLLYQPHHRNAWLPLLKINDIKKSLREAFSLEAAERFKMCQGAAEGIPGPEDVLPTMFAALDSAWKAKLSPKNNLQLENKSNFDNKEAMSIIWEGSQLVGHSLALINRELCLQLADKGLEVSVIPYEQNDIDPDADPRFQKIIQMTHRPLSGEADFHIRHQWPPNFNPPEEGYWIIIQPWEYGSLPKDWIAPMRDCVDEIWVPTEFVRNSFIKSGVPGDKVHIVHNGVNTRQFRPDAKPYGLKTRKSYRFLFVGGTIWRKGPDVILGAYLRDFSAKDDVCLVIKDMGVEDIYKGQTFEDKIIKCQENPEFPEIEYIKSHIPLEAMPGLYTSCHCLVHPYRGEGFGLPIAEAMACQLPVIVTGYGAAHDFCSDENAYFVRADEKRFEEKKVGSLETIDYPWYGEPDRNDLARLMRHVYENPDEAMEKGRHGRTYIENNLTWGHVSEKIIERMREIRKCPIRRSLFEEPIPSISVNQDDANAETETTKMFEDGMRGKIFQEEIKSETDRDKKDKEIIQDEIKKAIDLWEMGQGGPSTDVFMRLLKRFPLEAAIYYAFAELLIEAKKFEDALQILGDVPGEKNDAHHLTLVGYCLEGLERFDEAETIVEASLNLDSGFASTLNLKARLAHRKGDHRAAEDNFEKALKADSSYGEPHTNLGLMKWNTDQRMAGLVLLEKGFLLSPISGDIVTSYHAAISELGEFERGEKYFQDACRSHPRNKQLNYFLIDMLLQQGKFQDAMDKIQEAIVKFGMDEDMASAALAIRSKLGPKTFDACPGKNTLSLCMIVRDEEKYIAKCLSNMNPLVDEIVVVDTGSTDRTKEIARIFGASLYEFQWVDDFSVARNYSISKASGEWIMIIDADEVISPKDRDALKGLIHEPSSSDAVAYSIETRNYEMRADVIGINPNEGTYKDEEAGIGWTSSKKVRLFKNGYQIRFESPVHEMVEPYLRRNGIKISKCNVPIHHYGKLNKAHNTDKDEAYFRLGLKKLNEKGGDDKKAIYELAIQAGMLERWGDALELWKRFISVQPDFPMAYVNLATAYQHLGDFQKAIQSVEKAMAMDPEMKEAHADYAFYHMCMGNVEKTVRVLETIVDRYPDFLSARFKLGAAYLCVGKKNEGMVLFDKLANSEVGPGLSVSFHEIAEKFMSLNLLDYAEKILVYALGSAYTSDDIAVLLDKCRAKKIFPREIEKCSEQNYSLPCSASGGLGTI